MSITDKFDSFNINKKDRISQADRAWLIRREELYKRAIMVYKAVYDVYKSESKEYTAEDRKEHFSFLVDDFSIPSRVVDIQNRYISGIFNYFSVKYCVQLENGFSKYEHRNISKDDFVIDFIDYHTVLDNIFEQLGGMDFSEKAAEELKDKLKKYSYNEYRDTWDIKIKGNKFTYTGAACYQNKWTGDYEFKSTDWLHDFLLALSHNVKKDLKDIESVKRFIGRYYSIDLYEDDFKNGLELPELGVKHVKFYKNGRVDFTFESAEFCRDFARKWCRYTLV